MAITFSYSLLMALIVIIITAYLMYIKWLRSKYPPGPWPLPIIGNLHLIARDQRFGLVNLSKRYGPVYTIWMGSQPVVVLNNYEVLKEATVEKGVELAGRMTNRKGFQVILNQMDGMVSQSYSGKVQLMRKLALSMMKLKCIGGISIQSIVLEELQGILKSTRNTEGQLVDPFVIFNLPNFNTVMRSVIGLKFKDENDLQFKEWTNCVKNVRFGLTIALSIDYFPMLWYIVPGIKRKLESSVEGLDAFIERHVKRHEETYKEGKIRDVTDVMIKQLRNLEEQTPTSLRITRKNVVATVKEMIAAGSSTVNATIRYCILVLLYRPDIQEKIHQELDKYVAKQSQNEYHHESEDTIQNSSKDQYIFDLSDRPYLHYLHAFIHEVMRRCTIGAFAALHSALKNTSIGGHEIIKDTPVLFNLLACHLDESTWSNPLEVIPERFLDNNGNFDKAKAQLLMPFSGGPRRCVGENVARIEIFILLSNILYYYELCCSSVQKLPGLDDYELGLARIPHYFKMIFKPRGK